MRFRPCIDIHNGQVKQIVGGSLRDEKDSAKENFVSEQTADWYASLYRRDGLSGGHVILLNGSASPWYEATRQQALKALAAYPGGMQLGGGVTPENVEEWLDAGASHVIVTSYVFRDGRIQYENLEKMKKAAGKEKLVLDLSCRRKGDSYFIVTDRWQKFTEEKVTAALLDELSKSCSEFLIHAADVEGKAAGIEKDLVSLLGEWEGIPVTYAGGIAEESDLELVKKLGKDRLDVTIGSALDLFGGCIPYRNVVYLK